MEGDVYTRWAPFIFPALAFVYLQLIRYLDTQFSRKRPLTDEEFLAKMALVLDCTEYDIFLRAAREWHLPPDRVTWDFKEYLQEGFRPHYVNDFIRKVKAKAAPQMHPPFASHGGGYLPWLQ
jgi:hypothetical protein